MNPSNTTSYSHATEIPASFSRKYPVRRLCAGFFSLLWFVALATSGGCTSSTSSVQPVDTPPVDTTATRVTTQEGVVSGQLENDAIAFQGIPYAAPPLGDLRWKSPQPVTPWQGELDTTAFKSPCIQPEKATSGSVSVPSNTTVGSEDCLYLNVWTPATATSSSALPVMVFSAVVLPAPFGPITATMPVALVSKLSPVRMRTVPI